MTTTLTYGGYGGYVDARDKLKKVKPAHLTAEEAAEYGFTLEPGWEVDLDWATGEPSATYITPDQWKVSGIEYGADNEVLNYQALSPEGQTYTMAELEVMGVQQEALAAQQGELVKRLFPEGNITLPESESGLTTPAGVEFSGSYETIMGPSGEMIEIPTNIKQTGVIPGLTYDSRTTTPLTNVDELWRIVQEKPEQFLNYIAAQGRTPDTEQLLMTLGVNQEEIESIWALRENVLRQAFTTAISTPGRVPEKEKPWATVPGVYGETVLVPMTEAAFLSPVTGSIPEGSSKEFTFVNQGGELFRFPKEDIEGQFQFAMENPDILLNTLRQIGWSQATENFLQILYPDKSIEEIREWFPKEVFEYMSGDEMSSFMAGVGDIYTTAAGVLRWMGADGIGASLTKHGKDLQYQGPPDTLGAFEWKLLYNPRFYATRVMRTMPFTLSLIPAAIAGAYASGAIAGAVGLGMLGTFVLKCIGGAVLSRALESVSEGAGAYDEALDMGMSEGKAGSVAASVFRNNMALTGLDAAQFAVAFMPAPFKVTGNLIRRGLVTTAMVAGKLTITGLTEGGEEVYQEVIKKIALGQEIHWDAEMQEVMAIGGIIGIGLGSGGEVWTRIKSAVIEGLPQETKVQFETDMQQFLDMGASEEAAELKALDNFAETEEGKALIAGIVEVERLKAFTQEIKPKTDAERLTWGRMFKRMFPEAARTPEGENAIRAFINRLYAEERGAIGGGTTPEQIAHFWNGQQLSVKEKQLMAKDAGLPAPAHIGKNRAWWTLSEEERTALEPIVREKMPTKTEILAKAAPRAEAAAAKEPWRMTRAEIETEFNALVAKNEAEIARLNRIDPGRQQFGTIELSAPEIQRMSELSSELDRLKAIENQPAVDRILERKRLAKLAPVEAAAKPVVTRVPSVQGVTEPPVMTAPVMSEAAVPTVAEGVAPAVAEKPTAKPAGVYDRLAPFEPSTQKPPIERIREIHTALTDDVSIIRQDISGIQSPSARFARLWLKDASRLIKRAETLVNHIEQGMQVSEDEIGYLNDKMQSLKDFYTFEADMAAQAQQELKGKIVDLKQVARSVAQIKKQLVKYIKARLPLPKQGELLAKVANVKTEVELIEAIDRIDELYEIQTEKTLRSDIIRELKKTAPRIEKNITIGRLTPEIQRVVDKLRASLLVGIAKGGGGTASNIAAYENAQEKIAANFAAYQNGTLGFDALLDANEELRYEGMFGMSAGQLQDALNYIQELKGLGKDLRKLKLEETRRKRQEVVAKSVNEITGGEGIKPGVGTLRSEDLEANRKILDQPVNSQYGLVNLLDKLGKFAKGTKQYQGFLMRFTNLTQRAVNTENTERERTFKQVGNKFREIYSVPKTREATRMINALAKEDVDLGSFKITTPEGGVQYLPIKLTRAQMMEAYQLYKNPKNLETFRDGMHWTPEIMFKIVDTMTEQDLAWADWLQNEFYDSYYDKINPFYQREYNIDMPKNVDYVPQSRDFDTGETDEVQMLFQDQRRYASVTNKSLKARQENIRPFKFKGVFTVMTNHIIQMEHFMAWAETMHEMRSTFGNEEVRTAIRQYHGKDILMRLDSYMNDFARGGVDRAQFLWSLDRLRSNFVVAVLGLKPHQFIQQMWTTSAFMTEMKSADFVSGMTDFWKHPIENYKWMMAESAYLKSRYTGGNYERDIRLSQQQGVAKTLSGAGSISQWLLWQVTQGDKFGVMPGWWVKYQSGLKEGLNQADAMIAADNAAERTQNTSELASLSWLQRSSSWCKLLTMFQSQPNKYFRIVADNLRNMQYGRQSKVKGMSNLLIVWVILPMLFQMVGDAFKWKKEHQARVVLLGPLNNILVAGQLIQTAWGWFTDDNFDWQVSPVTATVRDFQNFSTKLKGILRDVKDPYSDIAMDDIVSAIEFFAKGMGQLTGAPTPYLIMVERAIRDGDPRELIFSRWALEEPSGGLPGKASKLVGQLGSITGDVTDLPVDKMPSVYNTRNAFSDVKQVLSKTLLRDVTEKNGFSPQVASIAKAIMAQDMLETMPDKRLFEIIDDIEGDNTLNYTFSQYYMDYQDRLKIDSLAKLKEWDSTHPRYNLGNVTPAQYQLMRQYEALETDAEKKQFKKDHPDLTSNPTDEWLKSHPDDNAQLAIWGKADIMTQQAYDKAVKLLEELDIPDSAVNEYIPPKDIAESYIQRVEAVDQWGSGSIEDRLIRAENPELNKWLGLQPVDAKDIPVLRISVEYREQDDAYDTIKADSSSAQTKAREEYLKLNPEYAIARRKREAYQKDVPEKFIQNYVEYYSLPETGNRRKNYLMSHKEYYKTVWLGILGNQPITSGGGYGGYS